MSPTFEAPAVANGGVAEEVKENNPPAQQEVKQDKRPEIRFLKKSDDAKAPTYGNEFAAGADLYSAEKCVVPAKGKYSVPTHINFVIPPGYYGRVAPRTGLAANNFIEVGAGVFDNSYNGYLEVLLSNTGETNFDVEKGDCIAQLIIERIVPCNFVYCDTLAKLQPKDH